MFAALQAQGLDPDDVLGDAERRGVLVIEPGRVRFRHPLIRSAAWATATAQERRATHAALAAALPESRRRARTWHQAEAATGPDADLAARLEAIAREDRARVGYSAASAALERAARLSDDQTLSAQRLAAAVEDAALAGDVSRARALATELLDGDADKRSRGRALAALGILEQCTGSIPRAAQLFAEAAEQLDGQLRVQVLAELAMEKHRLGDYAGVTAVAAEMDLVADRNDPHQRLLSDFFGGVAALSDGDGERGRSLLTSAFELYRSEPELGDEPRYLVLALLSAYALGLTPDLRRILRRPPCQRPNPGGTRCVGAHPGDVCPRSRVLRRPRRRLRRRRRSSRVGCRARLRRRRRPSGRDARLATRRTRRT